MTYTTSLTPRNPYIHLPSHPVLREPQKTFAPSPLLRHPSTARRPNNSLRALAPPPPRVPLVSRASTVVVLQFGFHKPYLRDSVSLLARRALVATLRRLPCNRSSHRSACAAARPSGRSALRDQSHGSTSLSAPGYAREERDQRRAGLPTGVRLAQLTSPRVPAVLAAERSQPPDSIRRTWPVVPR